MKSEKITLSQLESFLFKAAIMPHGVLFRGGKEKLTLEILLRMM